MKNGCTKLGSKLGEFFLMEVNASRAETETEDSFLTVMKMVGRAVNQARKN